MIADNEDTYGADFVIRDPRCRFKFLEVQVVRAWVDEAKYPYDHLSLFARKGRYAADEVLFISLNRDLTAGYLFELRNEHRQNLVPLFPGSREMTYVVPLNRCNLLYMHAIDSDILSRLYPGSR
jgi:hypothetical protein